MTKQIQVVSLVNDQLLTPGELFLQTNLLFLKCEEILDLPQANLHE